MNSKEIILWISSCLVMMLVVGPVRAGVYMRHTDSGTIELTNKPTDRSFKLISGGAVTTDADKLDKIIDVATGKFGMPKALVLSLLNHTNSADEKARQMPLPGELRGSSSDTIHQSTKRRIFVGTRYLRDMIEYFDGNLSLALAGYRLGKETVEREGGIPDKQTRKWVNSILDSFREFENREEIIYTYRDKNGVQTVVNISPSSS